MTPPSSKRLARASGCRAGPFRKAGNVAGNGNMNTFTLPPAARAAAFEAKLERRPPDAP
jgi:hypothetical protein